MTTARELAREISARNAVDESYRSIAASFPKGPDGKQIVKAGTVCRIAKSCGKWIPKDREIQIALGLKKARVLTPMQVKIKEMAAETRESLKWKRRKKWMS